MLADSAAVEEVPVWLEVNGDPAVTWMCSPGMVLVGRAVSGTPHVHRPEA